jgi:hypothetical protein
MCNSLQGSTHATHNAQLQQLMSQQFPPSTILQNTKQANQLKKQMV